MKTSSWNKIILYLVILMLWEGLSSFTDPIVLPSPIIVAKKLIFILIEFNSWKLIGITLLRTFFGITISLTLGIFLGIVSGIYRKLSGLTSVLTYIQSIPIISWLLLALIWFENRYIPTIIIIFSTMPIIAINIHEGILNIDKKILEMASIYKVNNKKVIKDIYVPSIIPYFFSSLKIILGLALKVSVMAEVIAKVSNGIGERLNWAWLNINIDNIIAWTIIIVSVTFLNKYIILNIFNKKLEKFI
ncbi:MAG: ABC transporter permease [Fusobacteriota bacterium]